MIRLAYTRIPSGLPVKEKRAAVKKKQEELLLLLLPVITGKRWHALPEIRTLPGGKPYFPAVPDFHYSFSDSGNYLILAAADVPVGLDLQEKSSRVKYEALSRRFYAKEEADAIASLPEEEGRELFFRLWSMKEAYYKLTGEGIFHGIRGCTADVLLEKPLRSILHDPFPVTDRKEDGTVHIAAEEMLSLPEGMENYILLIAVEKASCLKDIRFLSLFPVLL